MKNLRAVLALLALLAAVPAAAQQVQIHSVPIGKGGGTSGFNAAVPGTAGQPLVSNGASSDPSFSTIGNSGFTSGAADTYKGSLNGSTVIDGSFPSCTAVSSALRYTSGVGLNCGAITVQTSFDMPINMGLSASAAGGALTINLTQASGSAPTSGSPVIAPMRSTTATSGVVNWRTITSTQSITIPSGATLGTSNGVPFRAYIFLDDNGGSPALGVATCSNTTTIFPCSAWEHTLKTSITINASAGTAGVLYAGTGVSLDSVKIIGFCEFASGLVTAGTWASACTTLQVMGPGVKKPGDVVQTVTGSTTTEGTTSSATFAALASGFSLAITPSSTPNLVKVSASGVLGAGGGGNLQVRMVRGLTTVVSNIAGQNGTGIGVPVYLNGFDAPGAVTSQTYSFQGQTSSSQLHFPYSSQFTGGALNVTLEEVQG